MASVILLQNSYQEKLKLTVTYAFFFASTTAESSWHPVLTSTPPPPTDMQWALSLATKFNVIFAIYLTNFGSNPKSLN